MVTGHGDVFSRAASTLRSVESQPLVGRLVFPKPVSLRSLGALLHCLPLLPCLYVPFTAVSLRSVGCLVVLLHHHWCLYVRFAAVSLRSVGCLVHFHWPPRVFTFGRRFGLSLGLGFGLSLGLGLGQSCSCNAVKLDPGDIVDDHTTLKARHPVRSAKLSNVGRG